MINNEKLQKAIGKYKAIFDIRWNEERYKWEAVKWFTDRWDINATDFADMFGKATEKTINLLASMNNFPRKMMEEYSEKDPEEVRAMFIRLYDESNDVTERIMRFQSDADELSARLSPGLQHYQRPMPITVYLWLRYPDKYDIYKYSVCKRTCAYLENDFRPVKGHTEENVKGNKALIDSILEAVSKDNELISMYENKKTDACCDDKSHRMLAFDISFYIANYLYKPKNDENPDGSTGKEKDDTYTQEDFLSEVYMTREKYETLKGLLLNKKNIILQGAPGVGKTFAAKRLAYSIMGKKDDSRVEFIQFHQNYSYEDLVMGYKPSGEGFELQYGIFYKFCQKAADNPGKLYFFIIDEINRGNMGKIFGELLMLIEKDYRGTELTLAYNGLAFSVPENLYIIGMMNTADRSLALIDYALRRRFSFFAMEPGYTADGFRKYMRSFDNDTFETLIERIKDLNNEITKDPSLGRGFCIGHSYFCGQKECSDEWMQSVVEYDILPMLEEYWFDEPTKLQKWQNILRGVFND